ncbi:terminal uridylyltransferase Tailor [Anopheles marshallii]|uniref:terminal uridylyltransferase Tailor n=1 Tax=Anopheles marshallii TaxID=1521116 RepID=UPI00237A6D15|nr:terminal uridylyltransferase Tailor [Anopheles marshallii]
MNSTQYLATNLLIETLTLNLDTYDPGPKRIDTFILAQLETLMEKIQQFISDCTLVPLDEDAQSRGKIMLYFYQQPNVVRCRFCQKCLNEYGAAIEHIKMHERQKKPDEKESNAKITSFIKKNCIPKSSDKMTKSMRKFLSKNPTTLVEGLIAECNYVQNDIDNERVLKNLEGCLKLHYPSVKCYPFGSRIVGTGSLSSDIDMFVDLENGYLGRSANTVPEELKETVEKVVTILKSTNDWSIDDIILSARVPLLRVISVIHDNIHCDLTFSNGLAHRNSLLLQYMFKLQPTARQLVCYLKNWNRESCLNSYTLSLMVIFLYQCHKLLPSVAKLQEDPSNDMIIDGWNAGFATPTLEELNMKLWQSSVPGLAYMFFEFYSFEGRYFSMETQVVCPFLGDVRVLKSSFDSPNYDKVPAQMERLKRYMVDHQADTDTKRPFIYNKPFVVQDPFEHSHNVAKAIPVEIATRLMRSFELSLQSIANQKESKNLEN